LQTLAEPGTVVVAEQTRRLSGGIFEYRDLGRQELKGFEAPVQAWQVVRESRVRSRFHALRAVALTPLVGRQAELRQLLRLWDSARAGEGRAVLLSAEPGVGKSRLAEELATRIAGHGGLCLWYYCSPHLQSTPLAPLARQLTAAAAFTDLDDDDVKLDKLARVIPKAAANRDELVPLLANILSIRCEHRYPPLTMSHQRQKYRLFELLMQTLEIVGARRPVLLVVEDLHWIDPSSDELLGTLVDRLRGLPVLAILTARPEFKPHWEDRPYLHHIALGALDRSDALTMIGLLCCNRHIPEATIGLIADKTDGMPLFIEDLTKDVLEITAAQETQPGLTTRRDGMPLAIPTTLTDSLMSRLDRLGSAKAVAQVGAVIGREFSHELLAQVADLPAEQLKEELYRLVDSGLLISRRTMAAPSYAFKHALVRDAAYASLLNKAQAVLHARIAKVLIEEFPESAESQPDVLAYHFEAAKDIGNAAHYLIKAAKLSARRSGFVEAIAQAKRALELFTAQAPSRERMQQEIRAHLALGGIYAENRGFSSPACGDAFNAALELCHQLGDAAEIFPVLSGVGAYEITRANFAKCRDLAQECLVRAAQHQSRSLLVLGHLLLGGTLFLTGEFAPARKHLEEAIAICGQTGAPPRRGQVLYVQDQKSAGLCYLALTLTALGYADSGLRAAESGVEHSRALGGLHTLDYSLCYLAATLHFRRDTPAALQRATESLELAREQGFATWIGIPHVIRGAALANNGDPGQGLDEIARGIQAHTAMEAVAYQSFGLALLAEALIVAGRHDEALTAVERALATSRRTGERFYLAELLRLKGEALAGRGDRSAAGHCLRSAIDVARGQGARLFELRSATSVCRLADESQREVLARELLAPLCKGFEEGADLPDMREAKALLAGVTASGIAQSAPA
jgi:tetratricopeptide (TPR) repeat protein